MNEIIQLARGSGCAGWTYVVNSSSNLTDLGSNNFKLSAANASATITYTSNSVTGASLVYTLQAQAGAPDSPTVDSVVPGNSSTTLVVTYTQNPDNGTTGITYEYQVDSGSWVSASASPFTLTGLTSGTSYSVKIRKVYGGTNYATSTAVSGTAGSQTITYSAPSDQALSTGSLTVAPSASSGEAVTLTSSTPAVCTVSGFTISFIATGTCTTTAAQSGTNGWQAANSVTRTFQVTGGGGGNNDNGGGSSAAASPTPSANNAKVTLCHRTSSRTNPYVQITVDQSSVLQEGHGSHTGPLFPADNWGDIIPPFDGYAGMNWPAGQSILDSGCDGMKSGKVTLCHATSSKTNPYVLITVDQNAVLKKGHGSHTGPLFPQAKWGDIIPPFTGYAGMNWPAGQSILDGGCSTSGTPSPSASSVEQPEGLASPAPPPTEGPKSLKRKEVTLEPGDKPGEVNIVDKDGKPLTLLDAEMPEDEGEIEVVSKGSDLNKPTVWEDLGYGEYCWKLEPFNDQYLYTLPNPIEVPAAAGPGPWFYSNVIVKAGSVDSSDSTLQPNTVFSRPSGGDVVYADVNANGIFDPGGRGKDKAISHIIICASKKPGAEQSPSAASESASPSPSSSSSSTSASPSPSSSSSSTSASPSATSTPTVAPPEKRNEEEPPIIIRIKDPEESPSPTSSESPSSSSSTSSPSPSESSSSASPSTSSTSSSPSESASPTQSASPSEPGSTSSPTATNSASGSSGPSGSNDPSASESASPSDEPDRDTKAGTVRLTLAKGDSVLTIEVPAARMARIAARGGQSADQPDGSTSASSTGSPDALADTGRDMQSAFIAAGLLSVAGILLIPAVVRRRP